MDSRILANNAHSIIFALTIAIVIAVTLVNDPGPFGKFNITHIISKPTSAIFLLFQILYASFFIFAIPVFLFYAGARRSNNSIKIIILSATNLIIAALCIYKYSVTSSSNGGDFIILIYFVCSWIIAIISAAFVRP